MWRLYNGSTADGQGDRIQSPDNLREIFLVDGQFHGVQSDTTNFEVSASTLYRFTDEATWELQTSLDGGIMRIERLR